MAAFFCMLYACNFPVAVGHYDYVETFSTRKVRVRAYTSKGQMEQAMFALQIAAKCLDFFEKFFEVRSRKASIKTCVYIYMSKIVHMITLHVR